MPLLMEAYPGMTPATYWALTLDEYNALTEHANRRAQEQRG